MVATGPTARDVLTKSEPDQDLAATELEAALKLWQDSLIPFPELAKALYDLGQSHTPALRAWANGEKGDPGAREIDPKELLQAWSEQGESLKTRLHPALERQRLQALAGGQSGDVSEEQKSQINESMKVLGTIVDSAVRAYDKIKVDLDEAASGHVSEQLGQLRADTQKLWAPFAQLKALLELGVQEETNLVSRANGFSDEPELESQAHVDAFVQDQTFTRTWIPLITQAVDAQSQQDPQSGQGLTDEFKELAAKNLPEADQSMTSATAAMGERRFNVAEQSAETARRLLQELLDQLNKDQQDQNQEQQPEPQPNDENQPPENPNDQSQSDLERLRRAVEEKNRERQRRPPPTRSSVKEDW
jgi:hypothetical protein